VRTDEYLACKQYLKILQEKSPADHQAKWTNEEKRKNHMDVSARGTGRRATALALPSRKKYQIQL
jgi:hypothetical protein